MSLLTPDRIKDIERHYANPHLVFTDIPARKIIRELLDHIKSLDNQSNVTESIIPEELAAS